MNAIDINNLLDRDKIKEEIKSILQNFEEKKKEINIKRGIYLYGNPGSGKSYLINSILKEMGYDIILFDAGDIRNKSVIDTITKYNMADTNVLSMFTKKKKKIAIIMDEIDGMNNGDKGGLNTLIKLIRPKKTKKQKQEDLTMIPVLCIGNYDIDKKIKELMKVCDVIELKDPDENKMKIVIDKLFLRFDKTMKDNLKKYVRNDLRKLSMIHNIYVKNTNNNNDFYNIFQSKTLSEDVKTVTYKLMVNKNEIKNHNIVISETDRTIVALIWHENIIDVLSKYDQKNAIKIYLQFLNNFCFADYIDRITFQKQIWQFNEMSSLIKTFYNNYIYHESDMKNIKYKPAELRFTKVLTKYSTEYNNLVFIQLLCQELNMDIKDMLGNFGNIKNKYNLEEEDVYKKFETYEISKLDISRMYRYLDYLSKKTTEPLDDNGNGVEDEDAPLT